MEYPLTFKIVLILCLFLLSGFFSCSEAAFFSLNHLHLHRLSEDKSPFLSYIKRLLHYPRRLLITILVGNEAANISLSALMASVFIYFFSDSGQYVAIVVTTPLMLVFGEAIPKTFGVTHPITYSSFLSPFLNLFYRLLKPVVWFLERISGQIVSLFPASSRRDEKAISEDEFRELIDAGQKEGVLEEVQRDLIHRVFLMNDQPVTEIMLPRVDMFSLSHGLSLEEMEREILRRRHSHIPIYEGERDNIIGILPARALFTRDKTKGSVAVKDLLLKPYFVPQERSVASLLTDFRTRDLQMAIVVDEYGGVSGLVTLEDIIDVLFLDIYDDYGLRAEEKRQIDERTWIVSGGLSIGELEEITDLEIPSGEMETVGGFVFHLFGKLPQQGEEVSYGTWRFRVEQMRRARILKVRITREEVAEDG